MLQLISHWLGELRKPRVQPREPNRFSLMSPRFSDQMLEQCPRRSVHDSFAEIESLVFRKGELRILRKFLRWLRQRRMPVRSKARDNFAIIIADCIPRNTVESIQRLMIRVLRSSEQANTQSPEPAPVDFSGKLFEL